MSKRIMNELLSCYEALDVNVYYTDTDSIHIDHERLPEVVDLFEKKYGRELIHKANPDDGDLGQFHADFDKEGNYAVKSIFLGKKAYIDVLDTGNEHYRLKGIPKESIQAKAEERN
jgi:hypothetical protein